MMDFFHGIRKRYFGADKGPDLEEARYVVIDTELTGLNGRKDSIVSIGAVRMTGGRIDLNDTFYRLVNPEKNLTAESIVIHEITPSEVHEKPDIGIVLSEFLQFCGADCIVGYCVSIDMEFLNREARRFLGKSMQNPVIDIYIVFEWLRSRGLFPRDESSLPARCSLYDMAGYFGISFNCAHNAMVDAFITAQIYQRFVPKLLNTGMRQVDDVLKMSKKFKGGDRDKIAHGMSNF